MTYVSLLRIRVNCMQPGWVSFDGELARLKANGMDAEAIRSHGSRMPLRRFQSFGFGRSGYGPDSDRRRRGEPPMAEARTTSPESIRLLRINSGLVASTDKARRFLILPNKRAFAYEVRFAVAKRSDRSSSKDRGQRFISPAVASGSRCRAGLCQQLIPLAAGSKFIVAETSFMYQHAITQP